MSRVALCLAALLLPASAAAISVSIYQPAASGITALSYSVAGADIVLYETWGRAAPGFVVFRDLIPYADYWVHVSAYNQTGADWHSFAHELLDPDNEPGSADDFDLRPYPTWVPPGYTTSNFWDALSMSPDDRVPRISDLFRASSGSTYAERREYVDFFSGTVAAGGGMARMTFGLYDLFPDLNEPFLLAERPEARSRAPSVPEPSAAGLVGLGLLCLAALRRR